MTQVGDIVLGGGSASLTLPVGVTQVGDINLYDTASFTLPEGVTQVGKIDLQDYASLSLPESVTQVGNIRLKSGTSVILPDGFVLRPSANDTDYSAEEINKLLSEHQKKQEFRLADGTIYGYQQGDTIYLTPEGINPNTPIHEYAHIWAKAYEKLSPDGWAALKEDLKTIPTWDIVTASPEYEHIVVNEDRLAGEVLAHIVGDRGEDLLVSAAEGASTKEEVIANFRERIASFAMEEVFGLKTSSAYEKVTLKVLDDFVAGRNPESGIEFSVSDTGRSRRRTDNNTSRRERQVNENLYRESAVEFSQMTSVPQSVRIYNAHELDSYALEGAKQLCDDIVRRANMANSLEELADLREEMESSGLLVNGHSFEFDREQGLFVYAESGEKGNGNFMVSYSARQNESREHAEKAALQQMKSAFSLVAHTLSMDCDRELTKARDDDRKRNRRRDLLLNLPTFLTIILAFLYVMGYAFLTITTGGLLPLGHMVVRQTQNRKRHARRPGNIERRMTPVERFNQKREALKKTLARNAARRRTAQIQTQTQTQTQTAQTTQTETVRQNTGETQAVQEETARTVRMNSDGTPYVKTADEGEGVPRTGTQTAPTEEQLNARAARQEAEEQKQQNTNVVEKTDGDTVISKLATCTTLDKFREEMERLEKAFDEGKTIYDDRLKTILKKEDFSMKPSDYIARSVQVINQQYNYMLSRIEEEYKNLNTYEGIAGEKSTFRSTFAEAVSRIGPCSGSAEQLQQMKTELEKVQWAVDVLAQKGKMAIDESEKNAYEVTDGFKAKAPTASDYLEMANISMKESMEIIASSPSARCLAQCVNGDIIAGPAQILLQGDMINKGYSVPVYLTAKEVVKYGLNVNGNGVLVYFGDKTEGAGVKGKRMYNIDETDYPRKSPEVYNRLCSEFYAREEEVRAHDAGASPKMNTYKTPIRNLASRVMAKLSAASLTWSDDPSAVEYTGREAESCMAEVANRITTTDTYFNAGAKVAEKLLDARAAKMSMAANPRKGVDFAKMDEQICDGIGEEEKKREEVERLVGGEQGQDGGLSIGGGDD